MGFPILADGEGLPGRLEQMLGLAEQVDEQPVVVDPLLADQLAVIIMALERALDGALVRDRAKPACAMDMGGLAGVVEPAGVGAAADAVDALLAEADPGSRLAGDPGVGERLDIGALLLRGEAVHAVAQGHGLEGDAIGRLAGPGVGKRGEIIGCRLGRWRIARLDMVHPKVRT
jgi:hypothetical protein